MNNNNARKQALATRDAFVLEPTSLITYRSSGKVIALGDDETLEKCQQLPDTINISPVSTSEIGCNILISGHLGEYVVRVTDQHGNAVTHEADAILDLHETPILLRELLPPGYFHVPQGDWKPELVEQLEELQGEFEKPKYFDYDASICAHSVNGKTVCRQCIDACPAEAITSLEDRIEVNPYLCQGGGSCTTVCPSGAIRYLYPTLRDNGKRMRDMLQVYRDQGGTEPILLFHSENYSPETYLAYDNLLPLAVEELASVGPDLCLSALAYGAKQVVLHVDDDVPPSSQSNINQQLEWLQEILGGLGLNSDSVSVCRADAAIPDIDSGINIEPAILDMPDAKRTAIYQALDHLVAQLQPAADSIELPQSAPFGDVQINAEKCTLCMACVGACPGRALQDGSNREVPEVFFIENNCLQCGACVQTCPEDAVTLAPRMLFNHETRIRSRSLNQDIPFACITCGKPFAPTSVISKMQDKLKDHYMFSSDRARDRLKMCEDCRVVDIVQDPDAMSGQFDPLEKFRQ